jgi:Zn-dependent hydrolases, including glyoxylases
MSKWKIYSLYYGEITCPKEVATVGLDAGLKVTIPYMGYLLDNGSRKILVDAGIHERFIVNGKAWGMPAKGGSQYVKDSLEKVGVKPDDIEMVLYTHLHNDHAGNCHLFKNALHVFQDAEWKNLLDPMPIQSFRGDYDLEIIPELKKLNCQRVVGDGEIAPGIKFYKTPGHTLGSMAITVETTNGVYVMTGDTAILKCNLFPKMDKMVLMNGEELKITPAPYAPVIPHALIIESSAWCQSIYRLKLLVKEEKYALTGHEPSLVSRAFP